MDANDTGFLASGDSPAATARPVALRARKSASSAGRWLRRQALLSASPRAWVVRPHAYGWTDQAKVGPSGGGLRWSPTGQCPAAVEECSFCLKPLRRAMWVKSGAVFSRPLVYMRLRRCSRD